MAHTILLVSSPPPENHAICEGWEVPEMESLVHRGNGELWRETRRVLALGGNLG